MTEKERNGLVSFLMDYQALGKFKECVEKYGTVKNFYVFCDGVPVELALRSAFPWNMCDEETINGMPGDKFWEHLNSQWAQKIYVSGKKSGAVVEVDSEKIRVMARLFQLYRCPNSAKKFGGKIGATEGEVKRAIAMASSKHQVRLEDFGEEESEQVQELEPVGNAVKPESAVDSVGYDWANLTGIGNGRRVNGNRGGYPDGMMFRVKRGGKNGYPVLFSKYISDYLREKGCDGSMEMCQNRLTNQLVFVFGKGKPYQLSRYLSDGSLKVQNVAIVNLVESYVKAKFVEDTNYYIPVQRMVHSRELNQVAMVVTNTFKTEP